jgi:hypothetical protein
MARLLAGLCSIVLLAGTAATARAQTIGTPRSLGMGGAMRAASTNASAIFLNPAGIALLQSYVVTAFYDFHVQKNGHVAHSSVVDSIASKWIKAGLFYNLLIMRPDLYDRNQQKNLTLSQDGHEVGLTFAFPLGVRFSFGTTVKYQYYKATIEIPDPEGDGNIDHTVDRVSNIGVDLGMVLKIAEGFTAGITAMNVVPQKSIHAPITMGMGLAYGYKTYFLAAFDVLLDFTSSKLTGRGKKVVPSVFGGTEVFLGGKYAIRAGVMYEGLTEAVSLTGGFGYINPKAGVDVFVVQQVDGGVETRVGFAVKLFVR